MPAKPEHCRQFRAKLKVRAFAAIGTECVFCGSDQVEAAHVLPTGLNGCGRGQHRRHRDILRHPDKYRPMCKSCHKVFDNLRKLWETREESPKEEAPF